MDIHRVKADLDAIERDLSLDDELELAARVDALARLEFVDEFLRLGGPEAERAALGRRTDAQRARLDAANARLFEETWARFRAVVPPLNPPRRAGGEEETHLCGDGPGDGRSDGPVAGRALRAWLDRFTAYRPQPSRPAHTGYDALDALVDGALNLDEIPAPTQTPEREMIHLEPTPVRVVIELVDRVDWQANDVFYDVGSGLGQIPILVHLLTGVRCVGVEIEPAYCRVARAGAEGLGLSGVSFFQADAREADYRPGTVFYLFTPFVGEMLQAALDRLRSHTRGRAVTVCSFGPCSPLLARQAWLHSEHADPEHEFKLARFRTLL